MSSLPEARKDTQMLDQMRFNATDNLARLTITDYDNLSEEGKANQRSIIARKLRGIYDLHKHINADLVCQHVLGKSAREVSQEVFNAPCLFVCAKDDGHRNEYLTRWNIR